MSKGKQNANGSYFVNFGEFELVFFFVVEDSAKLVNEGHHRCLPSWGPQEADNHIEEPLLKRKSSQCQQQTKSKEKFQALWLWEAILEFLKGPKRRCMLSQTDYNY